MKTREFEAIFHQHYSPLCNYATKILGEYDVAEEIVQELFVQFLETNRLQEVDNVDRFLLRSTKFKCIDHLRKKTKGLHISHEELKESAYLHDLQPESGVEFEALFHYFVSKLPPKTRQVFLLIRESGYSYKEAAEELEVSPKTIENQMGSALKKLRVELKDHGYIPCAVFFFF